MTYKVVSDTVVEGLDCKIVENGGFRAVWYESDGKVYQQGRIYLDPDFDLMYDMAIEKGKYFNGSIDMYISSFTVAHLGKDVKVHKVSRSPGDDSRLDYWVEGVGPINGELIADPRKIFIHIFKHKSAFFLINFTKSCKMLIEITF